jgi:guanylate kinase
MPKFAIAFVAPTDEKTLRHRIVESADSEAALKVFFKEEVSEFYSDNEQGYHYFREDFFDEALASGSVIQCD